MLVSHNRNYISSLHINILHIKYSRSNTDKQSIIKCYYSPKIFYSRLNIAITVQKYIAAVINEQKHVSYQALNFPFRIPQTKGT